MNYELPYQSHTQKYESEDIYHFDNRVEIVFQTLHIPLRIENVKPSGELANNEMK